MTIYLYKKTHNVTGLKYLGQTTSANPHQYRGSGKRWLPHIKKHGYDVTTEILKECKTYEEIKEWGSYYSELWNVANSDEWANLKPEEGDGGWGSDKNPMKNQAIRNKVSASLKKFFSKNPKTLKQKQQHSEWNKQYWTDERKKNHPIAHSVGTVSVTDLQGNNKRISKTEYDSIDKSLPVEEWLYVSVSSKEAKRRNTLRTVT